MLTGSSHEGAVECEADLRKLQSRPAARAGLRDLYQSTAQAATGLGHRGKSSRQASAKGVIQRAVLGCGLEPKGRCVKVDLAATPNGSLSSPGQVVGSP